MKISKIKVELRLPEVLPPQESDIKIAILDESRGLQSTWHWQVSVGELDEDKDEDWYNSVFDICLPNFKDFQNENIVAFGTAYLEGGEDVHDQMQETDLPLRCLNKLTNGVVWRLEDYLLDYCPYSFRVSITLIYTEPIKIQGDFNDLFECGVHSDVVLVASDQENFKVHKCILSARSLVFRRMFENDMKEKQEGKVEIEDIRGPVLKELLRFMYSGKLPSMVEPGILEDLYVAADKYDVSDLKKDVAEKLMKGVTAENVKKRLAVAEQFEDVDLKRKCLRVMDDEPNTSSDEDALVL